MDIDSILSWFTEAGPTVDALARIDVDHRLEVDLKGRGVVDTMVEVVPNRRADDVSIVEVDLTTCWDVDNMLGVDLKRCGVVDNTLEVVGSTVRVDSNSFEVGDNSPGEPHRDLEIRAILDKSPVTFFRFLRLIGEGRSDEIYRLRT